MTLEEVRESSKLWLTPAETAPVLDCDPQTIRMQARKAPQMLGFPVIILGNRVKIPRKPFLAYLGEDAG